MNCKVIATSIASGREVRTKATFPAHNQNTPKEEDVKEMIEEVMAIERSQDAGCGVDILLVNSSQNGRDFINSFDGMKTRNGVVRAFNRENLGGSFGAYNFAFNQARYDYEFWMLTEDDIVIFGSKYYRRLISEFERFPNMGMLSLIDIAVHHSSGIHAHGGVGLTRASVLEEVRAYNNGALPHDNGGWDKQKAIFRGEIPLTRSMHELGYQLEAAFPTKEWSAENLCLPYYELKH